ncbi:hypothetical protein [Tsukamurella tyrosinosolvens]|uniref:hypothetical protein n=1 Tax=Tsukamurella tyrosinosolvens TaxID=57704 RepID=UPI002DD421FB|nr:hypothetical protein [Tsukamurella tyrosinosolvens]MEC4615806.1 hypothetical protein [Tsukamurella tyrosinosolvens]
MASPISELFPTLTGRQEPHHLSVTPGDTSMGDKAIELKRRVGVESMPWQRLSQQVIMSTTPAGRWTHPTVCLICTRQNGKSEILIDRCLYGLFKLDETILYTAQRWKTARDAWRRMMKLIKRRPWLRKHVVRQTCSQGEGVIELDTGALISFGTRSADAGRGLTVIDLIIYDEAYNLTDSEIAAMAFTQMAAVNPQRIYASSAVNQDQHPNGAVLAAVRRRGLAGEPRLGFLEWMAPDDPGCCAACAAVGDLDREDIATAMYANPSFGVIQTEEKLLDIKADLSTEAGRKSYDVEALGRGDWPDDELDKKPAIDPEKWGKRRDDAPAPVGSPVIGLVLAPDRRHWAIVAGQHTDAGRIHVELGSWRPMSHDDVVRYVSAVVTDWDPAAVVLDAKGLAKVIVPKLQAAGIEPELLNTPQVAGACGGFLDDVDDAVISHSGQPLLDTAARGLTLRDLPQGDFVFEATTESAPIVAAMLAREGVLRFASKPQPAPASPAFQVPQAAAEGDSGVDLLTVAF